MAENEKDITTEDLPEPISREDALLHNIIDGTPDISDLEPLSREEEYLKYIALNGGSGGGGGDITIVQTTGQSTTSVMSQKAITDNLGTKVNIVDGKGLSTEDFTTEYKEKLDSIPNDIGDLGTAADCDTGLSEGNVPILNSEGKLDNSVIPSLAITDTFVANSEEEMLNITGAEKGDICVRTDENKTYILDETPARYRRSVSRTSLSDWIELQTPTDEVTSVNGQKGTVVITAEDIDTYTKTEIDGKLPNIVQTRGTSTTDVMSQKAVSQMNAIGNGASAGRHDSIAFGTNAISEYNNIALGSNSNAVSNFGIVSIGSSSATSCKYDVVIGAYASSVSPSNNSVILGHSSYCNEPSVVSVGGGTQNPDIATRRIINVTDPINDQDAATKKYVDDKVSDISTPTIVQSTGTSETSVMSQNAVSKNTCFGYLASDDGVDNVTIGRSSHSTGCSNVVIGDLAEANIEDHIENTSDSSVAIGEGASVTKTQGLAIGGYSVCTGKSSVALGYNSKATEDYVVSVSNPNFAIKRRIVNVADPTNDQDAATKVYVDNKVADSSVTVVQTTGNSETDVMSQKAVTNNLCFGNGATNAGGISAISLGYQAKADTFDTISIGYKADSKTQYSIALGSFSVAEEDSVLSIGDGSTNSNIGTRRIVNVKDPVNNQDAATKNYVDGVVLYDNTAGTTSNITVSQAFSDFERIGIYYFANVMEFQGYQEIAHTSSGTQNGCVLSVTYPDANTTTPTVYIRSAFITFNDKTITFKRNMSYKISSTGIAFTDDNIKVSIYKVIGFKY